MRGGNVTVGDGRLASAPQNFDFLRSELQEPIEATILETIVDFTARTRETKMQLKQLASRLHLSPSIVQRHLDRLRAGLILDEVSRHPNRPILANHWPMPLLRPGSPTSFPRQNSAGSSNRLVHILIFCSSYAFTLSILNKSA
ncbi:MAG: hypothetical protein WCD86_11735 [Ktedonobacteraceae bacterium]